MTWKVVLPLVAALVLALYEWARRRIERHRAAFGARVAKRIAERHRDLEVVAEEKMALRVRLGSVEFRMKLDEIHRRALADPARFSEIVDHHVGIAREALGAHEIPAFETVRTRILPQVKNRDFLRVNEDLGEGRAIVARPFVDELVVAYVLDSEHGMTYLTETHLAQWGKGTDEIHEISLANLRRRSSTFGRRIDLAGGVQVVKTLDGYDAARVLILGEILREARDDILVGLPDRDTLVVVAVPENEQGEVAAEMARRAVSSAGNAITRKFYRLTPTGIVPLR